MNHDDDVKDMIMEENRRCMERLNRLFGAAFCVSAAPCGVSLIGHLVVLVASVMTVGLLDPSHYKLVGLILDISGITAFSVAHLKSKNGILASMIVQLLLIIYGFVNISALGMMEIFGFVMQILCLKNLGEAERLKSCEGYPDFNNVFGHRRAIDRALIERPSRLKTDSERTSQKNGEVPEINEAGGEMELLELPQLSEGDYSDRREDIRKLL